MMASAVAPTRMTWSRPGSFWVPMVTAIALVQVVPTASAHAGSDDVQMLEPVTYQAFDGYSVTRVPWQGRNVSLLVDPGVEREAGVMQQLVATIDRAYDYYADTTGRRPAPYRILNGRTTIAEVPSTCGAGCAYLGATGIEIQSQYFNILYDGAAQSNRYDQVVFYELGRNFWFWSPQLQFHVPEIDPVVTGYAVWMRFRSMAAAGAAGAPFNGTPFDTFAAQVAALIDQYEADPSLTFAETLGRAQSPGLYGGTDFWASIMMRLAARHGGQVFVERFFRQAGRLAAATTTATALANWVRAASYAACADLSTVFYDRWGFPRPNGSVTSRPPADSIPEPTGACVQPDWVHSVFRRATGTWFVRNGSPEAIAYGTSGDVPVPGDYDDDGIADKAVFRPGPVGSQAIWFVLLGGTGASVSSPYGTAGDIPVPGDYDGSGSTDIAVYRPASGTWFVQGGPITQFGTSGDIPVPGDYDGDGDTDIAVFRPSSGTWFVRGGPTTAWGTAGDIPVPGDYDGGGDTDVAVYRPSNGNWFVSAGVITQFGTSGDVPVPGDYDGEGDTDIAVFRPSGGFWFVQGGPIVQYGTPGDVPLPLPDAIRRFFFEPL